MGGSGSSGAQMRARLKQSERLDGPERTDADEDDLLASLPDLIRLDGTRSDLRAHERQKARAGRQAEGRAGRTQTVASSPASAMGTYMNVPSGSLSLRE